LSITIPQDANDEHNPAFKTPVDAGHGSFSKIEEDEEFDDAESEMMVMKPSDSMSSMGS